MAHQALRTALALYDGGTVDLETAARKAGVSPARLESGARRLAVPAVESREESSLARLTVASD